jgi:hypothetical protein
MCKCRELATFTGLSSACTAATILPPHFQYEAKIDVATGEPQAGDLPVRALRLIREWADRARETLASGSNPRFGQHRDELLADWELAQARKELAKIDPLP